MDNWDATVIRQLATQRHTEEIARGLATQRREAGLRSQTATGTRRAARRIARLVAIALLAGALALGFVGPIAAGGRGSGAGDIPILGDFCYAAHGGPARIFPRCVSRPLPVAPDQFAV